MDDIKNDSGFIIKFTHTQTQIKGNDKGKVGAVLK
jgi:hypothetical protein